MKRTFSLLLALLMVLSCAVMPVMAETEDAADLVNLYDFYQSCGDVVAEDGTVSTDTTVSSNSMIPVTGGNDLYFGPCTEGTVYLATYDGNGDFLMRIPAGDCAVTDTMADGSVIYSYTTASDVASVWVAAENAYAMNFMLTEGQPLDGALLDAYHAINPLEGKRALFLGDSITHGVNDTPNDHYGWAGRIGTANNMYWINNGQAGFSLSTCRLARGYNTVVSELVKTKYDYFDYVILHGGSNDITDQVAMGTITEGYDPSQFDVSTFAGGLEDLFYNAYYYYGKKANIGYIINYALPNHPSGVNLHRYFAVAKQICEKWNVRYFDMLDNTKVSADLLLPSNTYISDTIHPNKGGYDILAPMVEGFMKSLTKTYMPGTDTTDDGKVYNVTFKDNDGTVISTTTATTLHGIAGEVPDAPHKCYDGVVTNFFEGWTVNGKLVDAPDAYSITSDTTFVAKFSEKGYGARFEDVAPITIGDGSVVQDLLPEDVKLLPNYTGVTFVYKVEGVDSIIIADDFRITSNTGNPAWQWDSGLYSTDGTAPANLEFNNGYYYMYINANLFGGGKTSINSFSIYNTHLEHYYDKNNARDPKNDNENATFQMLAVTNGNLQPTVTFRSSDGGVIGTYTYKYTDINKALTYDTAESKYSYQAGYLMSADDVFTMTGFAAPEAPEGSVLVGWSYEPDSTEIVKGVYYNCDLYPVFKEFTEDDYQGVTFVDANGDELYRGEVLFGKLVSEDWPASSEKANDGVYLYKFLGWTIDGESVIAPAQYEYKGGEVIKPLYTVYGVVYDNPTAQPIPTDTSKEVNFMTEKVTVAADANGITWVYKVDGITSDIIADNFIVATQNMANPAWQWDDANYCITGDGTANMMTIRNGYFFVYANDNVNGMGGQTVDNVINKFAIYAASNSNYANGGRTPVNTNENATFTMLAVINDNLQPTATFHAADGSELISYTHKYTDTHSNLGSGSGTAQNDSVVKGSVLSVDDVFALTELATPTKEATHDGKVTYEFDKWVDAEGNTVDAVYYNVDLYPGFKIASDTREKYDIKFVDEDGTELYSVVVPEGETPVYQGEKPAKAADKKNTYVFAGWDAEIVPAAGNVTYKATYTATELIYTVTFMNGEEEIANQTTTYEGAVEAPADPTKETASFTKYTFAGWVDAEGNAVDLTKVEADMTVYASYTTECEHSFPDIKEGEWYEEAVEWALMNGVMNGEGSVFNPNKATTRGMIVTVLYRLEGSPDVSDVEHPFTDIKEGAWYYDAVKWAYAEEVVNGMSPTTYAPTSTLTREQFATILYRYASELKGADVSVPEGANLDKYTDKGKVSDYAFDAVLWTNVNGYISGTSETTLSPKGSATRAQMATILYRYINK